MDGCADLFAGTGFAGLSLVFIPSATYAAAFDQVA
jgi:hypothetical protein